MKTKFSTVFAALLLLFSACGSWRAEGQTASSADRIFPSPLKWKSTETLINPISDDTHHLVSIKDPTVVRYDGRWHVIATVADINDHWNMVYLSFTNWTEARSAKQFYLDANPNLRGYHCAPQVFYFRPHKKWYLIYQSQQPQYSTTDDISNPESWSKPRDFFAAKPPIAGKLWIDYWIICDDANAYLFFSGDDGRWYRSQTKIQDFPNGFGNTVIVMQQPERFDLFEASCVYRLKGTGKYLAIIECIHAAEGTERRYFKGFLADRLDGEWTPFADTWEHPFAGINNVTFEDGVKPWTEDISHGEMLRDGYDETLTVDPENLQFLYQGLPPETKNVKYSMLPYRLGLLRMEKRGK